MPTIAELKDALKAKGIKGYSGKNKAELEAMLAGSKKPTGSELLEAAIPKLKAALEAAMKPSMAKVVKAAKPIAPHATPVAVTALAKAPVRKPIVFTTPGPSPELEHLTLDRPRKAKGPEKKIPSELANKMRKDRFLMKAYNNSVDSLIEEIEKVMTGKGDFNQSITREYGADKAYELGDFYSMKWPRNANNVSIPKATDKLISQIPGHKYELRIYDTGDTEAYGRYNNVVMVLLESK